MSKLHSFMVLGGLAWVLIAYPRELRAQTGILRGKVTQIEDNAPIEGAAIAIQALNKVAYSAADGSFELGNIPLGPKVLTVFSFGKQTWQRTVVVTQEPLLLEIPLEPLSKDLDAVTVQAAQERTFGITRLRAVEGMAIYEGRKSEVVVLSDIQANTAANNPRQLYARVSGLNIWESDGAGIQLGVGGRGLSPNRSSNFNTRQNGYDISADALGYPESYYTPPAEALERIEVVRGAASLQYGTQFGGMLNFVFKKPTPGKRFSLLSRQSAGSFRFFNSYNEVSGTSKGDAFRYLAFYQRKQGDGWRENAGFGLDMAFVATQLQVSERFSLQLEYTRMRYTAQQPGGLSDVFFQQNPRQSIRARNWFRVNWDLASLTGEWQLSERSKLQVRNFALTAGRQALGNLSPINTLDFGGRRDLIAGTFDNLGSETRFLHRFRFAGHEHPFLAGIRLYRGITQAKQGDANASDGPDFAFLQPENVEKSDYRFPNYNYAAFAEQIIRLSERFTLTPGIRVEHIRTFAEGYYKKRVFDAAGNLIVENRVEEQLKRVRSLVLSGIGFSYKPQAFFEGYANLSQNYRAINFSDIRIDNPNGRVDPNLGDERGFTADIGIRSTGGKPFYFDVSAFWIAYKNRIGQLLRTDQPPLYNDYRLRTNIADSRNTGLEAFVESDLAPWLFPRADSSARLSLFVNISWIDARYTRTQDPSIRNKRVELVPPFTFRGGLSGGWKNLRASLIVSHTAAHFTDATNARRTASAVNGLIPAYTVADISVDWSFRSLSLAVNGNNLFNRAYFTRRAEAYPGPGIIPADGRSFTVTVGYRL
ncbi:MAG: TonB-dependent receptor domain-containing protein [Saprospiraceae bacterium]